MCLKNHQTRMCFVGSDSPAWACMSRSVRSSGYQRQSDRLRDD